MDNATRLKGINIVVMRPQPAASKTARALVAAGAEAIAMPLLKITSLPIWGAEGVVATCKPLLNALVLPTKVIFVSTHAAQFGMAVLKKLPRFYPLARFVAIGRTTAAKLASLGAQNVHVPASGEDSEALLAAPMLQKIRGQTLVIVRGESEAGGRTLLAEALSARGATVISLVCYRRSVMPLPPKKQKALELAIGHSTHVLAGSVETLDALEVNGGKMLLTRVPHLLVPHPRIALVAKARGAGHVSVVPLDDSQLIDALAKMAV